MEYGLIGEKLSHSFSPEIHGILGDYKYELCEVESNSLTDFFKKADFKGINVTVPYKESALRYMDELSYTAKSTGAVNTVINENGKLKGFNTDYYGLKALIQKSGIRVKGKTVLVLGSGGTAKTAVCVLRDLKAKSVITVSRTKSQSTVTYNTAYEKYAFADVIINTTPVGMYPDTLNCPVNLDKFKNLSGVIDVIYNPLNTALVLKARQKGIKAVGGLYMLIAQAVKSAELFSATEADAKKRDLCYKKVLLSKQNIVLIGMPGCGKSTIGKALANRLDFKFIDTDKIIEEKTGKSPAEIIKEMGEAEFRKTEAEVIKTAAKMGGAVIATGGGAVLNKDNIFALKQNGKIVFLDKPKRYLATGNRPLSGNKELVNKVYKQRYPLYRKYAQTRVKCGQNAEKNIKNTERKIR